MKKYSILFLLIIILAKVIYLLFEIDYNGSLLDIVSKPKVDKEELESLELYGHKLSSIGLTLLVIPFLYLLYNFFVKNKNLVYMLLVITSMIVYLGIYKSLTMLIDKIVEENKDKRYYSYYATTFKYGMLNSQMGYGSFIPKERLENLTIEDKVLIANIFLLMAYDDKLVDKVAENKNKLTETYLLNQKNKEYENKYKESENKFNSTLKEINNAFETYTSKTNEANKFLANIEKEKAEVNKIYEDVKINIFAKSYTSYRINSDHYMKGINPSNSEIETYYKDLSDYFKYHNFKRAQDKYNESMQENFGRYIEPISWCENNICPSKNSIRRVLKQEAERKWDKNIEPNLTRKEFFANSYTRSKIAKELNSKFKINLPMDFNYSKDTFVNAILNKLNKKQEEVKIQLRSELRKAIKKDIELELNYNSFAKYWKPDIIKEYGEKYGEILFKMIENKNTQNFYSDFYEPYYKENYLDKFILTKEQLDNNEHEEKGDYAIKSMFIIPFAIFMSLLASLLNFVSVIVLSLIVIMRFMKLDTKIFITTNLVKVVLYATIIYYPYKIGKDNKVLEQYKIFQKNHDSKFINFYVEAMNWILVVENFSYNKLYKLKYK